MSKEPLVLWHLPFDSITSCHRNSDQFGRFIFLNLYGLSFLLYGPERRKSFRCVRWMKLTSFGRINSLTIRTFAKVEARTGRCRISAICVSKFKTNGFSWQDFRWLKAQLSSRLEAQSFIRKAICHRNRIFEFTWSRFLPCFIESEREKCRGFPVKRKMLRNRIYSPELHALNQHEHSSSRVQVTEKP